MEIKVLKQNKDEIEFEIDNATIAEIMRVYLNENGADFAAWRREHPSKPLLMHIKADKVAKTITDAVSALKKDRDKLEASLKK